MQAAYPMALLLALAAATCACAQGESGSKPPTARELGFRLHPKVRYLSQGMAAGSFVDLGDGRLLNLGAESGGTVRVSEDDGKTWAPYATMVPGEGPGKPTRELECAIALRAKSGVIVYIYRDLENWRWKWDDATGEALDPLLTVWSIRSLDDGKTWQDRQMIFDGYCGSLNDIIQTRDGNIVVPVQRYVANPGRHCQCTYVSMDDGLTWKRSNIIDLGGHGHHDGAIEGSLTELADGRLLMFMRTALDRLWKAWSFDGGLTWRQIEPSNVASSNAPGFVTRLASGRLALIWNPLTPGKTMRPLMELRPKGPRSGWGTELPSDGWRDSLLMALSEDDGETWTEPMTIARGSRLCYPQIWERRPGELWTSWVAGKAWTRNLVAVMEEDLLKAAEPPMGEPLTIVCFGDSTTAPRSGITIYPMLLEWELEGSGRAIKIVNAGRGSDSTESARERFEPQVLAHKPDLVVLQFGLNDSAIDVWRGQTEPRLPIDEYERNLERFVTELKAVGSRVILMTPNPVRWTDKLKELYGKPPYNPDDPDGFNGLVREYAERCRQVAARQQVPLVDTFTMFQDYGKQDGQTVDALLSDGMHPNDAGHALEADALLPIIREMFDLPGA